MKNYFKEICSLFPIRRKKEEKQKFFEYVSNEFEQGRVKKEIIDRVGFGHQKTSTLKY